MLNPAPQVTANPAQKIMATISKALGMAMRLPAANTTNPLRKAHRRRIRAAGGNCANGNCGGGGNAYFDAMSAPWDNGGYGAGNGCGNAAGYGQAGYAGGYGCGQGAGCGYGPMQNGWFARGAGLIMSRDTSNAYYFSFFDANLPGQLLDFRDTIEWGGGAEIHLGKWFGCGCGGGYGGLGIEGVYWGLFPQDGETNLFAASMPGNLNAILNFNQLNYNGLLASQSTDNAMVHRLRGGYEVHNAEINLLAGGFNGAYWDTPVQFTWLAGFRYFRFDETLEFASDPTDTVFTGAAPELFYSVDVENNLYGFQLGGNGLVYVTPRLGFELGTKFGPLRQPRAAPLAHRRHRRRRHHQQRSLHGPALQHHLRRQRHRLFG